MFKIPEKIKIGVTSYNVITVKDSLGATLAGEIDFGKGVITLREGMTKGLTVRTFMHECIHGIINEYAASFEAAVLAAVENRDEHICKQLETGLAQVIDQIVEFNVTTADWFKSQANFVGRVSDYKRIGKLANLIAEYYKKEGNGCGGNCHLVLDDGNLEDSDIQFCIGYCAHANDDDGLAIMREMLSLNPEERQKVYDMASVLTNPRYTNNLDNSKEKS